MRTLPQVGMAVLVVHLGVKHASVIDEIRDDGRTLVVDGDVYALNRLTGHYVRAGGPYYGPRVELVAGP